MFAEIGLDAGRPHPGAALRLAGLAALMACSPSAAGARGGAAAAPENAPGLAAAAALPVTFHVPGGSLVVRCEVARTEAARQRGLMDRRRLEPAAGMLFVFDTDARRTFWMKDTLVPLDMIFLDAAGRVVGIEAGAEPLTLRPRGPTAACRFVVEVNAGFAAAHHIAVGTAVSWPR